MRSIDLGLIGAGVIQNQDYWILFIGEGSWISKLPTGFGWIITAMGAIVIGSLIHFRPRFLPIKNCNSDN